MAHQEPVERPADPATISLPGQDGDQATWSRPVTEIMSSPVIAVTADTRLNQVLGAMLQTGRRHMVVIDDAGRCTGLVSEWLLAQTSTADVTALAAIHVGQILTGPPPVVGPRAPVADAAAVMVRDGTNAVVVVDSDGRPVGVVTGSDLIRLLADHGHVAIELDPAAAAW